MYAEVFFGHMTPGAAQLLGGIRGKEEGGGGSSWADTEAKGKVSKRLSGSCWRDVGEFKGEVHFRECVGGRRLHYHQFEPKQEVE